MEAFIEEDLTFEELTVKDAGSTMSSGLPSSSLRASAIPLWSSVVNPLLVRLRLGCDTYLISRSLAAKRPFMARGDLAFFHGVN